MCVQLSRYQTHWNTELTLLFAPRLVLELWWCFFTWRSRSAVFRSGAYPGNLGLAEMVFQSICWRKTGPGEHSSGREERLPGASERTDPSSAAAAWQRRKDPRAWSVSRSATHRTRRSFPAVAQPSGCPLSEKAPQTHLQAMPQCLEMVEKGIFWAFSGLIAHLKRDCGFSSIFMQNLNVSITWDGDGQV